MGHYPAPVAHAQTHGRQSPTTIYLLNWKWHIAHNVIVFVSPSTNEIDRNRFIAVPTAGARKTVMAGKMSIHQIDLSSPKSSSIFRRRRPLPMDIIDLIYYGFLGMRAHLGHVSLSAHRSIIISVWFAIHVRSFFVLLLYSIQLLCGFDTILRPQFRERQFERNEIKMDGTHEHIPDRTRHWWHWRLAYPNAIAICCSSKRRFDHLQWNGNERRKSILICVSPPNAVLLFQWNRS